MVKAGCRMCSPITQKNCSRDNRTGSRLTCAPPQATRYLTDIPGIPGEFCDQDRSCRLPQQPQSHDGGSVEIEPPRHTLLRQNGPPGDVRYVANAEPRARADAGLLWGQTKLIALNKLKGRFWHQSR